MPVPAFVHLRIHSEFSLTDGILRVGDGKGNPGDAVKQALADGMPALALTDLMNVFGLLKFFQGARGKGIKPIVGADCRIAPSAASKTASDTAHRLILLVKNHAGYLQLSQLLTRAYTSADRAEPPEIRREWFSETGADGLIALSGAAGGDIGEALLHGHPYLARERAETWARLFPGSFYLELQRYGQPDAETLIEATLNLAAATSLPVVATHPVQFLSRDDFSAHEAKVCIAEGYTLGDTRRPRHFTEEQYFKSTAEMAELFADLPEALENTVEIARRCNLELTLGKNFLPQFPTPEGISLDAFLAQKAREGLETRLLRLFPDPEERIRRRPEYDARLETEIATIIQMGFPGYFLIVADFINWGKANGVPVGPGRGSGAGSLAAFALGITDIDPLPYALLFERFLNPERVSMPDFDIDFCQDKRYRVIEYVRERYGADAVSQIATFGTLSSKSVIRDVGRVLDMPYSLCDSLSKLIPVKENKPLPLAEALEAEPALKAMLTDEQDGEAVTRLFDFARRLEDLARNVGMHAGGVLIAPGRIADFCPIYQADVDASPVSQFDKDDVETIGLVKFDFLGLKNLTIIELALDYVERLTGARPDLMTLGLSDPAAYHILQTANTTAIFQVESEGMKKLLKKLAPDCFEDIIAVLALFRPGPLGSGMVDDFILRKKGAQKVDYFHLDLKDCLSPTYGVIVYQEQVMQISQIIGGYTLGGADLLRRAMGKKKPEEMAKHRETIVEGAKKKGYAPELAEHLFDLMTKFAEYGFNKSHTAAYAIVTYQTAWLKAHHCAAFMAATLSSDMDNTDTVKIFHDDAKANGLLMLGPDVNVSGKYFEPVDEKQIRYGLGAIKGVGGAAADLIVDTRKKGGAFRDLFDFCRRLNKRQVNRRALEALVKAGAFDALDADRGKLFASIALAMEAAEQAEKNALQVSLFGEDSASETALHYLKAPPWEAREKLLNEREALGFFFSGHLFDIHAPELSRFVQGRLAALKATKKPKPVLLAGIVVGVRTQITKNEGKKIQLVQIEDGSAAQEISVSNEVFENNADKLKTDTLLLIEGEIRFDEYRNGNRVEAKNIFTLGEARSRLARSLRLRLEAVTREGFDFQRLKTLLTAHPGVTPVLITYQNPRSRGELVLGAEYRVMLDDALLAALRDWLTPERVEIRYG
ncbi:MAG: DNA polymerase III subunit alpha [Zoogloeaceae bacterium]|jgi:DNA polymerase-3 subunit alpha|nr:DNA polymerase III subunit alpha [Zoogloeaceae bacterium]